MQIQDLNDRTKEVLRLVVTSYMETGDPVGSRYIARNSSLNLSPASIRNIMSDLEEIGLLIAPHISSGRMPTATGLQLFVKGLLQIGELETQEKKNIIKNLPADISLPKLLDTAAEKLSGLTKFAGLVIAPKRDVTLKQLELIQLDQNKAIAVMVTDDGEIENRLINLPKGAGASELTEAANFISKKFSGKPMAQARDEASKELKKYRQELSQLTASVVKSGLAEKIDSGQDNDEGLLIVRGQHLLLDNVDALDDLERIQSIFSAIDKKRSILQLLEATENAEGVQVFIGAENSMFSLTGCSAVFAPIKSVNEKSVMGAIGVIGPSRMNYSRIVPLVDFTADIVGKVIDKSQNNKLNNKLSGSLKNQASNH